MKVCETFSCYEFSLLISISIFLANSLIKINVGRKGVEIEVEDDEILK